MINKLPPPAGVQAAILATLVFALSSAGAAAQCNHFITTTYAAGNGCSGNFFDIQVVNNTTICSFDVHVTGTNQLIEVWAVTGGGSYVPVSGNPAAWTLLGTAPAAGGTGIPSPLNMNLNYTIPSGTVQGFIIRNTTSTGFQYTNGTTAGNVAFANGDITIFEGNYTCTTGTVFPVLTSLPRIWNGTIHYNKGNLLSIAQSGPGIGDLTATLADISPTGAEGWTLVTSNTGFPVNGGPMLGIMPDAVTWQILGYPYFPGNPFHFNAADPGVFPNAPFIAGPGSVTGLTGLTLDFVVLLLNPGGGYDSASNVARVTFQ